MCGDNVRTGGCIFQSCPTRRPRHPAAPHRRPPRCSLRRRAPWSRRSIRSRRCNATGTSGCSGSARRVSLIGTWMQTMAQGWLALELSNSAFLVGLVASAGSLPVLVLSLYAGVLADRVGQAPPRQDRQIAFCLQACALWWFTWSRHITIAVAPHPRDDQRRDQRVRDPGAAIVRHRARRPRRSSRRDRAQLERVQPRARRRPEHRRRRSSRASASPGASASTR